MSIKKYETLLKTVDLGSLTRAAEELGYTQSAISQILSGLEGDLDLKLLIRDRAGVRLTEAGRQLLPAIRHVCEANEEVQRQVASLHGQQHACLRIGYVAGLGAQMVSPFLSQFSAQHPEIRFSLTQASHSDLCLKLEDGVLDCAFVCLTYSHTLQSMPVMALPLCAVFPPAYVSSASPFSLSRLGELPLLLQETEMELLQSQQPARALDDATNIYLQSCDDHAILAMVKHGLGMAILPTTLQRSDLSDGLTWCPITPALTRCVHLLFRDKRSLSALAKQFVQMIRETLDQPALSVN